MGVVVGAVLGVLATVLIASDVRTCVEEAGTEGCADSGIGLEVALSPADVIIVSDCGSAVSLTEAEAEVSSEEIVSSDEGVI